MGYEKVGKALEKIGGSLMLIGGLAIAAIFLIVLVNGSWPDFLQPVQMVARGVSSYIGGLVWLIWVVVFIGPGFVIQSLGNWLRAKA